LDLAKHITVGGGNKQRSRWHLADPKVRSQDDARVRNVSSGSACRSSLSVLRNQPGNGCRDQHRCDGQYGSPRAS